MQDHSDIRIGTLVKGTERPAETIRQIAGHGFETFQVAFGRTLEGIDLDRTAAQIGRALQEGGGKATVSSIGIYGNPLTQEGTVRGFEALIDSAEKFGCSLVCGFAGRLTDRPVSDSIPRFKEVFGPLVRRAEDRGVRIAFENCDMGGTWEHGDWNIAHAPAAWEMIFNEIPSDALGLEWEPCHQMVSLVDPLPQLRQWVGKVFHLHGKDASVNWDLLRRRGIRGPERYVQHRTPGFGDTNWTDVISILRQGGFHGAIDIEGWHDPVYKDALEMTGQVHALRYLQQCRGGPFIENPDTSPTHSGRGPG